MKDVSSRRIDRPDGAGMGEGEHLIKQWPTKLLAGQVVTEIFDSDRIGHLNADAAAVTCDLVQCKAMLLVHWVVGLLVYTSSLRASSELGAMLGAEGFRQVSGNRHAGETTEDGCEDEQALHRGILCEFEERNRLNSAGDLSVASGN